MKGITVLFLIVLISFPYPGRSIEIFPSSKLVEEAENTFRTDYSIVENGSSAKVFDVLYDEEHDALWYTILASPYLYSMKMETGNVTRYYTGDDGITPNQIILDDHHNIWFTDYDFEIVKDELDSIGMFNTTELTFEVHSIPTLNSAPIDIEYAFGSIWVSEWLGDKIIKLDMETGLLEEKKLECGSVSCAPLGIAHDQDKLYLLETGRASILTFDPSTFNELDPIQIPDEMPGPVDITVNGDLLWLGIHGGDQIAWYNKSSKTFDSKFTVTPDSGYPISGINEIKIVDSGSIWFSEHFVNWMGQMDPASFTINEYPTTRTNPSNTQWMTTDGERVWFAEVDNGIISEFTDSNVPKLEIVPQEYKIDNGGISELTFRVKLKSGTLKNMTFDSFAQTIFTYGIGTGESFSADLSTIGETEMRVGISVADTVRPGTYDVLIGIRNNEIIASLNVEIFVNPSYTALYYLGGVMAVLLIVIAIYSMKSKTRT